MTEKSERSSGSRKTLQKCKMMTLHRNRVKKEDNLIMGNLMLAAHDLGVGSCWIHRAKQEFEMPERKKNWVYYVSEE